jgi:hypothetical protein
LPRSCRTSTLGLSGKFANASIKLDGTSRAYLTGAVRGGVSVSLSGISTAYVQGQQGERGSPGFKEKLIEEFKGVDLLPA